ncbi:MAG: hypothetical protein IM600_05060 [Bacteroidetes bacterium]|jgi:hypothetical protein|nr:hypothetical protein [Bacteroidota bacterium]MCA6442783.1 hypothetical protein [Bacteroidota bacterium]
MRLNVKNKLIAACVLLAACQTESAKDKPLSNAEKARIDSVSKANQKRVVDSLKKLNPLLILPPDSEYTGDYEDRYRNGIVKFKGQYRFGQRHGMWLSFFDNGLKWSELEYDKGNRNGLNIVYYTNGKTRYKGFYKNDLRDSVWQFFDTTGTLIQTIKYNKDKEIK